MFSGLTSRWTMLRECRYSIESRICAKSEAASASAKGPLSTMRLKSSPPDSSSITMYVSSVLTTTSLSDTMCGWLSFRKMSISVSSASRFSSSDSDLFSTTLTAYPLCSFTCTALFTTEKRPRPSSSPSLYSLLMSSTMWSAKFLMRSLAPSKPICTSALAAAMRCASHRAGQAQSLC